MDRRNFLAMGGVVAVAGARTASAHEDGTQHVHLQGGLVVPTGKLLMRRIPSSGESIPAIGLGTSGPFEVGADDAARAPLRDVLAGFFAGGAALIDTSPMYSTAEAVLGDLLTPEQQAKAFIATKVWTPGSGAAAEQKGIEQMQRSMALLKHKRIELMQVHNLVDLNVHLKTLTRWKAEDKIKYIGVTHYTTSSYPDLIAIIAREKIDFVQFNYSVTTREAELKLLPLCADKGVAVLINRAFEDGNLFTKVQGKALPAWAEEFGAKSWAQVFLKFVLANPAVTCVIPATGKFKNLVDNLSAGMGPLPNTKQLAQIVAALQ
ncbi:MAG TPA: aldo/keto reductase [Steroidobacteraceae bacterium]|jgi:aryl-alcohol dehydrogenase-like predicted oxidoreductase|nr:aldo/keto reductase [Steroidobacteraceae bacterium]